MSRTNLSKIEVARRHLGTALWLFIEDLDPVSVHTLAASGGELAEHLAREVGNSPFIDHVLQTDTAMTPGAYYRLARQHYNAFKHATRLNGTTRDDEALLADFDDRQNHALLFIGWSDLLSATGRCPIEAQVFQAWFYASYPEKLAAKADAKRFSSAFPGLLSLNPQERKGFLRAQIALARTNPAVMQDSRTDASPLVWGN